MICIVRSAVDPKKILINQRYSDIRRTPKPVKDAVKQLVDDATAAREEYGWSIDKNARLKVTILYTMNDRRADVDGPGKRALDAIAAGLGFNDQRVDDFRQIRGPVGTPGIIAEVETLDHHDHVDPPSIDGDDGSGWFIMPGESVVVMRS